MIIDLPWPFNLIVGPLTRPFYAKNPVHKMDYIDIGNEAPTQEYNEPIYYGYSEYYKK